MKPRESITVDVNKWLEERQNPGGGLKYPGSEPRPHPDQIHLPSDASVEERKKLLSVQEDLREQWQEREELAQRAHLLDNAPRECVECSDSRMHYKNDYICYRCRDKAGGPA
jgi:hypothetical protein